MGKLWFNVVSCGLMMFNVVSYVFFSCGFMWFHMVFHSGMRATGIILGYEWMIPSGNVLHS